MGEKVVLVVEERDAASKKAKQLRRQGLVPAVMYGGSLKATSLVGKASEIQKVYQSAGKHHPVELHVGSHTRLAMIKNADFDPVKRVLRHVSFHVIRQDEKVQTEIPLHVANAGQTPAEKAGLVVLTALEAVAVEALPNHLPDAIDIPSDTLVAAGDHITVADLKAPQGVTILADPEIVVASVYEPSALAAQNEAAAGDAQEATLETEEGEPAAGDKTVAGEQK